MRSIYNPHFTFALRTKYTHFLLQQLGKHEKLESLLLDYLVKLCGERDAYTSANPWKRFLFRVFFSFCCCSIRRKHDTLITTFLMGKAAPLECFAWKPSGNTRSNIGDKPPAVKRTVCKSGVLYKLVTVYSPEERVLPDKVAFATVVVVSFGRFRISAFRSRQITEECIFLCTPVSGVSVFRRSKCHHERGSSQSEKKARSVRRDAGENGRNGEKTAEIWVRREVGQEHHNATKTFSEVASHEVAQFTNGWLCRRITILSGI